MFMLVTFSMTGLHGITDMEVMKGIMLLVWVVLLLSHELPHWLGL